MATKLSASVGVLPQFIIRFEVSCNLEITSIYVSVTMDGINVTQDLSEDDDILVLKVVKPNLVTPNKSNTNNVSPPSNRVPKYDND